MTTTRPHTIVTRTVVNGEWVATCIHPGCPNDTWTAWRMDKGSALLAAEDHEDLYAYETAEWENQQ